MAPSRLVIAVCFMCVGCTSTFGAKNQAVMDEYDPRNNIPLLQAGTRTSGVNVPQAQVATQAVQSSAITSKALSLNGVSPNPAAQKLREIKALKDEGILTQKEYDAKKADILKGM